MSQLTVSHEGRVTVLTMTGTDAGNRITQVMAEELSAALDAVRCDASRTGCVLTGQGNAFCLGGDYHSAGAGVTGRLDFARAHIELFNAMARLGKPLVAAVNGNAHAGGFSLVVACDLAFMAEDANMGLPEAAHGLFPFLALAMVRDALPQKLLFELVYHSRLLAAGELCALHLVNAALPRAAVLPHAIAAVERATHDNPAVLALGRELYYGLRAVNMSAALEQARLALAAALSANDQWRSSKDL
jgi:enoyl-CoA hydratase/carnithine racemase